MPKVLKNILIAALLLIFSSKAMSQNIDFSYRNASLPIQKRVDILLSQMTVEEKNMISHRGLALQKARTLIIERLNKPV